jgi:hypothetical protein
MLLNEKARRIFLEVFVDALEVAADEIEKSET